MLGEKTGAFVCFAFGHLYIFTDRVYLHADPLLTSCIVELCLLLYIWLHPPTVFADNGGTKKLYLSRKRSRCCILCGYILYSSHWIDSLLLRSERARRGGVYGCYALCNVTSINRPRSTYFSFAVNAQAQCSFVLLFS
jgi:hypothetical protein